MDRYDPRSMDTMFLSSAFGVWTWDKQNDILFFNQAYMEMLGYMHDAFPFHISTWNSLLHPEDKETAIHKWHQILEGSAFGDLFEEKFRLRTASGAYLWILTRGFVLCRDAQGQALHVSGMHIDLHLLEQTSEEIAIQHDRMLFALEAANDGLWDWNPQTDEVYFSPRYIAMLGYPPQEFPPTVASWIDRIHPDDLEKTIETQRDYIQSPARGDMFDCVYRFRDAAGEYRWILGRGKIIKRDQNGIGVRVVGLHTDVTELRNAQEALVELLHKDNLTQLYSRFYFDSILNTIEEADYPISIIFCDLDGLKMVNDILGHTDGDKMLINAATILRQSIPPDSIAARLGGDEFAVLLCNITKAETEQIALRIQKKFELHNDRTDVLPSFMSLGIAYSERCTSVYKILSRADEAMLKNKKNQRKFKHYILISRIEKMIGRKIDFFDNRYSEPES